MRKLIFTSKIMALFLTVIFPFMETALARETKTSRTIIDSYMMGYSTRSAAMGFCAVNLVDNQAAFHNPGAMGLYHLDKTVSVTWFENPDFSSRNHSLYNIGASVRVPYLSDYIHPVEDFKTSLSLGFSTSRMNYRPWFSSTDEWFDKSNYYSIGFGFEYFARLGFGYMYSDRKTTLLYSIPEYTGFHVTGAAHDFGLITDFPLIETISKLTDRDFSYQELEFELTPSYAYVWSNMGDNTAFADRFDNAGISLLGEIFYNQVLLSSLLLVRESERYKGGNHYDNYDADKVGYEFCFGGFYYLRWGSFVNDDYYYGDYEGYTDGFGFSTKGISDWLYALEIIEDKGRISDKILRNVDISYDVSNYDQDARYFEDNIYNLSISF